ncbi:MerR family transcriptional regulator [Candidatus Zixiibacteriota bacterium]
MLAKIYTAGEVAKQLGIPYYTLDYLERVGKIPAARRTGTNKRIYTKADVEKIRMIRALRGYKAK